MSDKLEPTISYPTELSFESVVNDERLPTIREVNSIKVNEVNLRFPFSEDQDGLNGKLISQIPIRVDLTKDTIIRSWQPGDRDAERSIIRTDEGSFVKIFPEETLILPVSFYYNFPLELSRFGVVTLLDSKILTSRFSLLTSQLIKEDDVCYIALTNNGYSVSKIYSKDLLGYFNILPLFYSTVSVSH